MSLSLGAVTLDCADALAQARFWSELLRLRVDDGGNEDFAAIGLAEGNRVRPAWTFIKVPEQKNGKNRFHPDLITQDLGAEVARAERGGARKVAGFDEGGVRWTTLVDPEGNEFDIVAA